MVFHDTSLSTEQKLKALNTFREPIPGKSGTSNIVIYAQCHHEALTTTLLPQGETLKVLNLWPIPEANGGGGLAEMFLTKGTEFQWPKPPDRPYLWGYRCQVFNYGDAPVFNIEVELQEVFREITRDPSQPDSMKSGEIKVARKWPIQIDKIDIGPGNPFTFYIYNMSETMVMVSVPDVVTLQTDGNNKTNVPLIHSEPMQFWPPS